MNSLALNQDEIVTFRMPRWLRIFYILIFFLPVALGAFASLLESELSIVNVVYAAIALFGALWMPRYTVRIQCNGVMLYGLWWLPWSSVKAVRYRKVLGLPCAHVKRHRGLQVVDSTLFRG
jgi:MFS-type transporter involved in bile tolerance (Atg22 family)